MPTVTLCHFNIIFVSDRWIIFSKPAIVIWWCSASISLYRACCGLGIPKSKKVISTVTRNVAWHQQWTDCIEVSTNTQLPLCCKYWQLPLEAWGHNDSTKDFCILPPTYTYIYICFWKWNSWQSCYWCSDLNIYWNWAVSFLHLYKIFAHDQTLRLQVSDAIFFIWINVFPAIRLWESTGPCAYTIHISMYIYVYI